MTPTRLFAAALFLTATAAVADESPIAPPPSAPENGVQIKLNGDSDDGATVINRLPPDVRAHLSSDQIEQIIRREQDGRQSGVHHATEIVVPGLFFGCILGIVLVVTFSRFRRERQLHETLRAMIEKGVEIPPALLMPPQKRPTNDKRRGVVLVSLGVGLAALLAVVDHGHGAWAFGLLPLLLGAGYLVAAAVDRPSDG